jgi:hypothetical protein
LITIFFPLAPYKEVPLDVDDDVVLYDEEVPWDEEGEKLEDPSLVVVPLVAFLVEDTFPSVAYKDSFFIYIINNVFI